MPSSSNAARVTLAVLCSALAFAFFSACNASAQISAIASDPPEDKANPPSMATFQIPSHGEGLNAMLYQPAGGGVHSTVVLLHGFPGNEKNLDIAQAIRRSGWNVLFFNYRGSWGTHGDFSFTHCMEDVQASLAYLRDPANATRLHLDPARIVVMGHSMGGMIAAYIGAHDKKLLGIGMISAADMAGSSAGMAALKGETRSKAMAQLATTFADIGMAPLAGCTPESLVADILAHPEYAFAADATGLKAMPVLIITSDDGNAEAATRLGDMLEANGNGELKSVHLATDHSYSGKRIALTQVVLDGLTYVAQK